MLEGVIGIAVAFFLIAEPIFIFNAYGKKSIRHRAKVKHKTESLMKKAQENIRNFSKKQMAIAAAKQEEKHDIVKAQGFVDRLKYFVDAEEDLLKNLEDFVRNQEKRQEETEFPQKEQLINLLNNENGLVKEAVKALKKAELIAERVEREDGSEAKIIKKDLHKALGAEKQAKFEHSVLPSDIKIFKQEYGDLARFEEELKSEEHVESKICKIVKEILKNLRALKRLNDLFKDDWKSNLNLDSLKQRISDSKLKKAELAKIIVGFDVLNNHLKKFIT